MELKIYEFEIESNNRLEIINITSKVEKIVRESGIKDGFCLVFLPHATATILLNEDEPRIRDDYKRFIEETFKKEGYKHDLIDSNAYAHVCSAFTKAFAMIPIKDSKLYRGTWQEILLAELDGPRRRKVFVLILGSKKG